MRIAILLGLFLLCSGGSMAQDMIPIPTCRLIRVIDVPLRKDRVGKMERKFALLDVCLPAKARDLQHPQITFQENDIQVTRIYEVVKVFADRAEAEEYARKHGVRDIRLEGIIFNVPPERVSDCYVIRSVETPLTKRPGTVTESKIALLNTCLKGGIPQQRPVVEVVRDGMSEFREFEIAKIFGSRNEAESFARTHKITDLNFDQ